MAGALEGKNERVHLYRTTKKKKKKKCTPDVRSKIPSKLIIFKFVCVTPIARITGCGVLVKGIGWQLPLERQQ